jgi:hypothetical protein
MPYNFVQLDVKKMLQMLSIKDVPPRIDWSGYVFIDRSWFSVIQLQFKTVKAPFAITS